jgi:hypothetical protein
MWSSHVIRVFIFVFSLFRCFYYIQFILTNHRGDMDVILLYTVSEKDCTLYFIFDVITSLVSIEYGVCGCES